MNTKQQALTQEAERLWATFNDSERFGVSFGMLPREKMQASESKGFDSHQLTVALMDIAQKRGK